MLSCWLELTFFGVSLDNLHKELKFGLPWYGNCNDHYYGCQDNCNHWKMKCRKYHHYLLTLFTWCWWGFRWSGKHCGFYCYDRYLGWFTDRCYCIGCSSVWCQGYFHVCAIANDSNYCCINWIDNFTNSYFWVKLTPFRFCTFWLMFESNFFFLACKHCTSIIPPASILTYITVPHCKFSS